ncbi:hypothetical protein [Paenibacillus vini]|uniref:Uncharacterized protein n=1 Tax=Paenibacillus vini TaxID=1476024 RepID=A0ABQ4MAG7_9BACL|nr:hypothetical protein [Paenibacillus vini]GIP52983.1 hypothetical protein J42TS3_20180 [Paenibacillus vini]
MIKAGTVLVKLEPSRSGYFTTLEAYEKLRRDGQVSSIELSEGLQVAPWRNRATGNYEYRGKVSFTTLQHDIEAAYGEKTLANQEYGQGSFVQIYIAGYDGNNRENNRSFGLEETGSEELSDTVISEDRWKNIQGSNHQHLLKRDLFCYQKCRDDFNSLMREGNDDDRIKDYCEKQLNELELLIQDTVQNLQQSIAVYGRLDTPTYDAGIRYLAGKHRHNQPELNAPIEQEITRLNETLMTKVEGELTKPAEQRSMNMSDLQKTAQWNQFIQLSGQIRQIKQELAGVQPGSSLAKRSELFKKLTPLLNRQIKIAETSLGTGKSIAKSLGRAQQVER